MRLPQAQTARTPWRSLVHAPLSQIWGRRLASSSTTDPNHSADHYYDDSDDSFYPPSPQTPGHGQDSSSAYDVSRLITDLDSPDCPIVRPVTDQELADEWRHVYQAKVAARDAELRLLKRQYTPVRTRKATGNRDKSPWQEDVEKFYGHGKALESFIHISAFDLLCLAVKGPPIATKSIPYNEVALRLHLRRQRIGVSSVMGFSATFDRLMYEMRGEPASLVPVIIPHPAPENEEKRIGRALWECTSPDWLYMTISQLGQTTSGCQMLNRLAPQLIRAFRNCHPNIPRAARSALFRINALVQNLLLNGIKPHAGLCDRAMLYAAVGSQLPALHRYIKLLGLSDVKAPEAAESGKTVIQAASDDRVNALRKCAQPPPNPQILPQLLHLLTGWESGGVPSDGEERGEYCFRAIIRGDGRMYKAYVLRLAQLSATEALRWEWANGSKHPVDISAWTSDALVKLYIRAFVEARDFRMARRLLESLDRGNMNQSDLRKTQVQDLLLKRWIDSTPQTPLSYGDLERMARELTSAWNLDADPVALLEEKLAGSGPDAGKETVASSG